MLKQLRIRDFVLIDYAEVTPGPGLNIITGETGAGKSILIDALGLLLGARASVDTVRTGALKTVVEGTFITGANNRVISFLNEQELDTAEELILRREVSAKGQSRCFINDTPVTLALLKECGDLLVDLHGQHDHQSLLDNKTHIDFLDQFIGESKELAEYSNTIRELEKVKRELATIEAFELAMKEKSEFLTFQLQEIDAVQPKQNEDEELQNEIRVLENAETLISGAESLLQVLYEEEGNVYTGLSAAIKLSEELSRTDENLREVYDELRNAFVLVSDAATVLRDYTRRISLDEERLETIRTRLLLLQKLKKKYGGTLESVLSKHEDLRASLIQVENSSEKKEELKKKISSLKDYAGALATILHTHRVTAGKVLETAVPTLLHELGIKGACFVVKIQQLPIDTLNGIPVDGNILKYNTNGAETVEFLISTNPGEGVHQLHKTASGGEISRVMLALKSALANTDKLPLLIFDEIDTGVSGRIANKVGEMMYRLSGSHQIIAITHLPQIAALADYHFSIRKEQAEGRSFSRLHLLNEQEHIREVASLMSGENITDSALKGAEELIHFKGQILLNINNQK